MARLIAIALPGGPRFVHELELAWSDGDAVLPIDPRLPEPAAGALIAAMGPSIIVDQQGRHSRPDGRSIPDGDALVVATSGTTGTPKGVVLTHEAVAASAHATSAAIGVDPSTDMWIGCLPVAHIGGLSVVTRAMITKTRLEVVASPDPELLAEPISEGGNLISLVPAALDRVDPTRFKAILLGGSAIPSDRPSNSMATYGMTETGSGVVYDGKALDGVEVKIVDDEIWLRGPMLCRAYRDGTTPIDDDGWLATGDLGSFDNHTLQVFGRADDTIVTGGEKVYPAAVEKLLRAHPSVGDVAVVGRPHHKWGSAVTALVQVRGDIPPTLDDLRDLVKAGLPAYAAPHGLEVVDDFPRTALGKIARHAL